MNQPIAQTALTVAELTLADFAPAAPPSGPRGHASFAAPPAETADAAILATDAAHEALIESRQRWRDLVTIAADIVFETDARGRFVFVSPEEVLGWPAASLIGQPSEVLLAEFGATHAANPFRPLAPIRRRRAWLRRADQGSACFSFAAVPLLDAAGRIAGARGLGQDMSHDDLRESQMAAALRRAEVVDHILWRMRQEVLAPRMMQSALEALAGALGAEGAAVIDMLGDGATPELLHSCGQGAEEMMPTALSLLDGTARDAGEAMSPEGRRLLGCPTENRFGERIGLVAWRAPGARPWDADEPLLAAAATGIIRVILEHDAIQREMSRQARTDPLTGLLNRRAFLDSIGRRIDRLDREGLPGTLLFLDMDNFKPLNDSKGHDVGDDALCIIGALLRTTVRPADLVARFGGDEFAIWLDGADELAAAERAEALRVDGPEALAHLGEGTQPRVGLSIGIATRWPTRPETLDDLIHRADRVMYEVKRAGGGQWRVAPAEEP